MQRFFVAVGSIGLMEKNTLNYRIFDSNLRTNWMESLFVKNMVCSRCIMVVETTLKNMGLPVKEVVLGEVVLEEKLSPEEKNEVIDTLSPLGFELIDEKRTRIIEKIKNLIVELVQNSDGEIKQNLSQLLSDKLHHDYSYLSNLFSEVEGTTIEKYYIAQKIEKVKELLVYDELTLSEISLRLGYSSVAYLSNQFKKVTGLTPSHFKKIGQRKRRPLDEL